MALTWLGWTALVSRAAYLRLCILTSLRKRRGWLLLTCLLGGGAGLLLGTPQWGLLIALAALLLQAAWIAAGSYQRHRDDDLPLLSAAPEAKRHP